MRFQLTYRRLALWLFVCASASLAVPLSLGFSYTDRLAARPSYYAVSAPDTLAQDLPAVRRPRRTVLVLVDGLGYIEALGMPSLQFLQERGQCRKTDVGSLSLSRPMYGVISTGVEQDRGGALTNDAIAPHAAESIWEIARAAGLKVATITGVPWWQELFPRGFQEARVLPMEEDYIRRAPNAELLLVHLLYVDEMGHEHGAAAADYREAVSRADRDVHNLLATLDLNRDLLIVTADHGHTARGGHGGRQDRVAHVLTCYAGVGVQHQPPLGKLRATTIAPSLALLLGLHFPSGMRAGDDDLDTLWQIADPSAFSAQYLNDRRQAIERARETNRTQLTKWQPQSHGSWTAFYEIAQQRQRATTWLFIGLFVLVVGWHARAHRMLAGPKQGNFETVFGWAWILGCGLAAYALQTGWRGSFDLSSVNNRSSFIHFTLTLGIVVGLFGIALHLLIRRRLRTLLLDMSALSLCGLLLSVAQPVIAGFYIGFPLASPIAFFFPYFAALYLSGQSGVAILLSAVSYVYTRRLPPPIL